MLSRSARPAVKAVMIASFIARLGAVVETEWGVVVVGEVVVSDMIELVGVGVSGVEVGELVVIGGRGEVVGEVGGVVLEVVGVGGVVRHLPYRVHIGARAVSVRFCVGAGFDLAGGDVGLVVGAVASTWRRCLLK